MTHRLFPVLFASALALAACGGSSDDDASAPSAVEESAAATSTESDDTASNSAEETSATTAPATTPDVTAAPATLPESAGADETSEDILVDDLDDMPEECVELMADFLVLIEPVVKDIDWDTATSNDFQAISEELDSEFSDLDTQTAAAGCDAYDFGDDDASLAAMLELAEEKAPGVTGWLQFIGTLTADPSATATDAPATCDEAIAYIEELIAETPSMGDVPISKMAVLGQVMTTVSTVCDPQQSADFFSRADVTAFMSG